MSICRHCSAHVSRARTRAVYMFKGAWWQIMINDDQYFLTGGMYYRVSQKKQKWPNMAGLSKFQSGRKGHIRAQNGQPRCFWPFGTLLGPSGPFGTLSNEKWFLLKSTPAKPYFVLMGQQIDFCLKWSKSVQMGPKRSQIVNKKKGSQRPARFGHFCVFYWCGFFGDTL